MPRAIYDSSSSTLDLAIDAAAPRVLSVTELNRLARAALEQHLPLSWVSGEISNFKRYDSGHCYFTLKDENAQVECVMFRQKATLLGWQPESGMQVEVRASATLYEARGKFQITVEAMRRAGLGALYEAFERSKARLEREGLFDPARKRVLPRFPRTLGIVTSPKAAALRDVLTILERRAPGLQVIIYPTPVQGEGAAARIAEAITIAGTRAECDVLIVCRGGGSIEDLWAYNDERLARVIRACPIPIVSGVGHETDFTIADFVADVRAPTPTAAAQLASPDRLETCEQLRQLELRIARVIKRGLEDRMQRLDYLSKCLVHPGDRLRSQMQHLTHLANRLCGSWNRYADARTWDARRAAHELATARPDLPRLERHWAELVRRLRDGSRARVAGAGVRLAALESHLKHLNPELVLERGYSIAVDSAGAIVRDASQLTRDDELNVTFARGSARTRVEAVTKKAEDER
ncbi:MAG TPA: exodeoxyribonuclease VII large subunit [Burkholderiales bacterium]|nr:exodeoxyribonuclease VII large subunit [Burkholderiales bacterium]